MAAVNEQLMSYYLSETNYRLLAGGISGIVSRSVTAPFERTVILRQTNDAIYATKGLLHTLGRLIHLEGPLSLFKGNLANCFRVGPFQAIEFYTFDTLKQSVVPLVQPTIGHNMSLLLSGAFAGALAYSVVYPFDLTKTILAVQHSTNAEYRGIFPTMVKIVQKGGLLALWRGMSATLIGITPYASLKLTFFQLIREGFESIVGTKNSGTQNMMFGGLAGCMALTITYPTDVIRRRLQVQIVTNQQRRTYIATTKEMYRTQGIKVFYTGLLTTYLKVMPSTAIAFALNEKLKQMRCLN